MFKYHLSTIIFILIPFLVNAQFGGGDGTEVNPYQISNFDDLLELSEYDVYWESHFILTNNIDASSSDTLNEDTENPGVYFGFLPIGNESKAFSGTLNGNGHSIKYLFINRLSSANVGLFGKTSEGASIENVGMYDCHIAGGENVGGLVGKSVKTIINQCFVSGDVRGMFDYIGGVSGYTDSVQIDDSYSNCVVVGNNYVAGIAGYAIHESVFSNCYSTGALTGVLYIGGIVGLLSHSSIINCYATGAIFAPSRLEGGIVDGITIDSFVENSFFDMETTNSSGRPTITGQDLVTSEFSDSNIFEGWDFTNHWLIDSLGRPYLKWQHVAVSNSIFNLCDKKLEQSYVKGQKITETGIVYRLKSEVSWTEIITGSIEGIINNTLDEVIFSEGNDYYLTTYAKDTAGFRYFGDILSIQYREYGGGCGSEENPFVIENLDHLRQLSEAQSNWSYFYILNNDIDASDTKSWNEDPENPGTFMGFSPIGNHDIGLRGTFDGNGHTISNLYISRPLQNGVGLLNFEGYEGLVKSLTLENCEIIGNRNVGSIAGSATRVLNCHSSGKVTGYEKHIGGLVGYANRYVDSCSSSVVVEGVERVGGLVGQVNASVKNCRATGDVTGTGNYIGGLVGFGFRATATNSFASGRVKGNNFVGGLVGEYMQSALRYSHATGNVSGNDYIGGLVGALSDSSNSISGCYAAGEVVGNEYIGGLVGRANEVGYGIYRSFAIGRVEGSNIVGGLAGSLEYGKIQNCYTTTEVIGLGDETGGLCGDTLNAEINNSYWDTITSGISKSNGGSALTTTDFENESSFNDWDFKYIWTIALLEDLSPVSRPYLKWQFTYQVTLTIIDQDGSTLSGIQLTVGDSTYTSDRYGSVILNNLEYHVVYHYSISASGYYGKSGSFIVESSDNGISIQLKPIIVDIEKVNNSLVTIFPNPTNGRLIIKTDDEAIIRIFSLSGKLINNKSGLGSMEFDLSNEKPGMYIVTIVTKEHSTNKLIIKN